MTLYDAGRRATRQELRARDDDDAPQTRMFEVRETLILRRGEVQVHRGVVYVSPDDQPLAERLVRALEEIIAEGRER